MSDVGLSRKVSESQSERSEIIFPGDANALGNLFGGRLMQYMDLTGAMAASRHARAITVTASMDHLDFVAPVHVGDLLILKASVNRAFRTSMEVGVKAMVEDVRAQKLRHVSSAYITFVAVDHQGRGLWCHNWSWRRIISGGAGKMRGGGVRCGRERRCGASD